MDYGADGCAINVWLKRRGLQRGNRMKDEGVRNKVRHEIRYIYILHRGEEKDEKGMRSKENTDAVNGEERKGRKKKKQWKQGDEKNTQQYSCPHKQYEMEHKKKKKRSFVFQPMVPQSRDTL